MQSGKFRTRLAVMLTAIIASVVVVQAPASAGYGSCGYGLACIFDYSNGEGSMKPISVGEHIINKCYNFTSAWNDKASSVANNYGMYGDMRLALHLWIDQGCKSPEGFPQGGLPIGWNFHVNISGTSNNNSSSFKIVPYTPQ